MIGPEDDDVALFAIDQLQTAQDERAQKDVAQLGINGHELEQLVPLDLEHLTRHCGGNAAEKAPAGQDRPLSREHPGGEADGQVFRCLYGGLRKRSQPAGHDHKNLGDGLTRLADHLTVRELTTVAVRLEALQLCRRELREGVGNCRGWHVIP